MISWIRELGPLFEEHRGRMLLPLASMGLVALRWASSTAWAARHLTPARRQLTRRLLLSALVVLAAVAVLAYNNFFNYHFGDYVNDYEFFHYYMGSKYFAEVGYVDLYHASLVADDRTGRWYQAPDGLITDLESYHYRRVDWVLQNARSFEGRFTPERWVEFVSDVDHFKRRLGPEVWNKVLRDKGYNATPVWTMLVGGLLSNRVSAREGPGLFVLALLDVLLVTVAIGAVWWAFGAWPALLLVAFMGSSYLMAHVHLKGAFLRTDFVVCLVGAACLLRKQYQGAAGCLVALATLSRIFPAVFLFGLLAKSARDLLSGKRDSGRLRFYAAFGLTLVVLVTASAVYHGGTAAWSGFATKIALHRSGPHIWNLGLSTVVHATFDVDSVPQERRAPLVTREGRPLPGPALAFDAERDRALLRVVVQLAALAATFLAALRVRDHDAFLLGFVPLFFLTAPTYYYYVVLVVPFIFFAGRLDRLAGSCGTIYLFLIGLAGFRFYALWDQYFPTTYWNAVMILLLALFMLGVALARTEPEGQTVRDSRLRSV